MIEIYDTTLRDGTQREGISLSCDDKIRVARRLDELGVTFIEGGWPGSNPKDAEFFERARDIDWAHAKITAFGSTHRVGGSPEGDANLQALLDAGTPPNGGGVLRISRIGAEFLLLQFIIFSPF